MKNFLFASCYVLLGMMLCFTGMGFLEMKRSERELEVLVEEYNFLRQQQAVYASVEKNQHKPIITFKAEGVLSELMKPQIGEIYQFKSMTLTFEDTPFSVLERNDDYVFMGIVVATEDFLSMIAEAVKLENLGYLK
jgi:hypothetical protein